MSDELNQQTFSSKARFVIEGETLVVYRWSSGVAGLAAAVDVRRFDPGWERALTGNWWTRLKHRIRPAPESRSQIPEVRVPPGTHLILIDVPCSLRQRYGLESQEGAILTDASTDGTASGEWLKFNNGTKLRLEDLREGQSIEVLSLAGTQAEFYEEELLTR